MRGSTRSQCTWQGKYLLLLVVTLASCAQPPRESETQYIDRRFQGVESPQFLKYHSARRLVRVAGILNHSAKPLVVFVHGSPGDWRAFASFMAQPALQSRVQMVSVDRPGFGRSGNGHAEVSMKRQAELLRPVLDLDRSGRGAILVGHSLGGAVIARLAMDYPDKVAGLVFIAPSIDPALEEVRWYNHLAANHLIRRLLPEALLTSNEEILPLRRELEQMVPRWKDISAPSVIIQGTEDDLVPAANADFAQRMLVNAPARVRRIQGAGHFVLWEKPELVIEAILGLL